MLWVTASNRIIHTVHAVTESICCQRVPEVSPEEAPTLACPPIKNPENGHLSAGAPSKEISGENVI